MTLSLDTTILIDVLRGKQSKLTLLAEAVEAGHMLATAAINIAEVYAASRPTEEAGTTAFLSDLVCYPMTAAIARRAGILKRDAARRGRTFSLADMIVAATAIEHGLTLVTDNQKDFAVPGILLFKQP